ncbi:hypothetical protein HF329_25465 [Chitinophaga oryzae]|uniref:Uncharacterized protein n=1 Tax=Chitinophaga oryzae TaxID=2725414 RepID=A0AAE6ZLR5_9BACT|nr:hypothetical protein [Chitinophaga oryzae]QJB34463.1 hypothetical protein HF329_25465 [Chitinophaga oryzae]
MKWWMIGCLMIGPVSLQAQVSSGKITEAPASGKQVLLVADSGHVPQSRTVGGAPAPFVFSRSSVSLFGNAAARLSSAHTSGGFNAEKISSPPRSGGLAAGRLFFDGLSADGLPADKVSFGSFPFALLSREDRANDNFPQRTALSSRSPSPACLMTSHAYYDQHFGFFCKKEWVWQKQTGIPVKLRLGSYDLTQRQEGK